MRPDLFSSADSISHENELDQALQDAENAYRSAEASQRAIYVNAIAQAEKTFLQQTSSGNAKADSNRVKARALALKTYQLAMISAKEVWTKSNTLAWKTYTSSQVAADSQLATNLSDKEADFEVDSVTEQISHGSTLTAASGALQLALAAASATAASASTNAQNAWTAAKFSANASGQHQNSAVNNFQTALSSWWTTASAGISSSVQQASGIVSNMISNMNDRNEEATTTIGQKLQALVDSLTDADKSGIEDSSGAVADFSNSSASNDKTYLDGMAVAEKAYLSAVANANYIHAAGGAAAIQRDSTIASAWAHHLTQVDA